jgi:exonuclease III
MKILSLNCRGLEIPHKKYALKQLIFLHQPDIIILQETMIDSTSIFATLTSLLPGWTFLGLD